MKAIIANNMETGSPEIADEVPVPRVGPNGVLGPVHAQALIPWTEAAQGNHASHVELRSR